jgi:E3 ubiquitin-protein ligase NEDD4
MTAIDNNSNHPNPTSDVNTRPDQQLPLPLSWEQSTTREGRVYYINHNTHKTTWNDPRMPNPEHESVPVSLNGPPLPPGWEAQRKANGQVYFINHNMKSTTWEDPRRNPEYEIAPPAPSG